MDYVDDDQELIVRFLENVKVRQVLQRSITAVDSTNLFSGTHFDLDFFVKNCC